MKLLEKAFTDHQSPLYIEVNNFFALITLISVLFIALEAFGSLQRYAGLFNVVEWIVVALFSFEYICRIIAEKRKIKYIFSFYGLTDLIAVLPTYFGLANFSFLKIARITRILRFLRLTRLVKITRMRTGK